MPWSPRLALENEDYSMLLLCAGLLRPLSLISTVSGETLISDRCHSSVSGETLINSCFTQGHR